MQINSVGPASTIEFIAQNGRTQAFECHANLVRLPRFGQHAEQPQPVPQTHTVKPGNGGVFLLAAEQPTASASTLHVTLDPALLLLGLVLAKRQVDLAHLAFGKRLAERAIGFHIASQQQQPRGARYQQRDNGAGFSERQQENHQQYQ